MVNYGRIRIPGNTKRNCRATIPLIQTVHLIQPLQPLTAHQTVKIQFYLKTISTSAWKHPAIYKKIQIPLSLSLSPLSSFFLNFAQNSFFSLSPTDDAGTLAKCTPSPVENSLTLLESSNHVKTGQSCIDWITLNCGQNQRKLLLKVLQTQTTCIHLSKYTWDSTIIGSLELLHTTFYQEIAYLQTYKPKRSRCPCKKRRFTISHNQSVLFFFLINHNQSVLTNLNQKKKERKEMKTSLEPIKSPFTG